MMHVPDWEPQGPSHRVGRNQLNHACKDARPFYAFDAGQAHLPKIKVAPIPFLGRGTSLLTPGLDIGSRRPMEYSDCDSVIVSLRR